MKATNWLIVYDIADPRRLQKVAKAIKKYGIRVQKSVFEVSGEESFVREIRAEVKGLIDLEHDFVVYFNICEKDWQKKIKYGKGKDIEFDNSPYHIF